jgi:hypothetical protein
LACSLYVDSLKPSRSVEPRDGVGELPGRQVIHHIAGTKTEPVEIACDSGVARNVDRAMVEGRRATVEQDDLVAAPHKKARETPPRKPGAPRNDVTHARTYPAGVMRPPRTGGTRKTRSSLTFFPKKKESNPLMNHGFARAQDIA